MISQDFQTEIWNKLNSIERRLIGAGGGSFAPTDAEYVVMSLSVALTDERRLQAGEGIQLADGGAGGDADLKLDINGLAEDAAVASGDFFVYYDTVAGDHKKLDLDDLLGAQYVVMALSGGLTDERRLQASEGIALSDGGAGGDADLALDINGLVEDAAVASGDFFVYYDYVAGDHKKIDFDDMPGAGAAPVDASYIVIALNATLTDERRLQGGEGIALVDGGAGNDLDVDLDINSLVEDAAGASGDFFVYYDSVAGDHKKIDWDDMPGGGGGGLWTADVDNIYFDTASGNVSIGVATPSSKSTQGLTINQGGYDDNIITLQSSDVNHGMTTLTDTDTFGSFMKFWPTNGGLRIDAFTDNVFALEFDCHYTVGDTSKGYGAGHWDAVRFRIGKKSGTTVGIPAAHENIYSIQVMTSPTVYRCKWRIDAEGDVYQWGDFYLGTQSYSSVPALTLRRRASNNIWIGMNGGAAWTTGDRNYSLGDYALAAVTYGSDNIALGYRALIINVSGVQNVSIGHDTLEHNIDSDNNIAIGHEAMESHDGAGDYGIVAIGYHAAWADANVPRYSVFIGHSAGSQGLAIGDKCVGIGYRALVNTSGDNNTALGYYAGGATAITGASNVMIGGLSAGQLTSGAQNTIVGADGADNINTGSDNVAIGFQAGNGTSTGSQNVWIGSLADGSSVAARTNSIAIGYNVSVNADNKIVIGNASHTIAVINGALFLPTIKSGANQAGAGAAADEIWKTSGHATLPDNVVMIGI